MTIAPDRRLRVLAALLLAALTATSCASIPETSDPRAVKRVDEANATTAVPPPPQDVDPLALVRNFVDAAADPGNDYAAARLHLSQQARHGWRPPTELLIVDDVDTIPGAEPPGTPATVQTVSLQVTKVGRLKADHAFVPEDGEYEVPIRVERQLDGQWRISDPPPELVVSRAAFRERYRQVPVYFLDHGKDGVVPDLRYVVNQPSSALPARVVNLLMGGPSQGFRESMESALPPGTDTRTNVSEAEDGALVVNLSELGDPSTQTRKLIAAQIVLSLQGVSNARVRILEDGTPLLPDTPNLYPSDVASFEADNAPRSDVPGLAVVDERLVTLDSDAAPVPGASGTGQFDILRAGRSSDGGRIAAVTRRPQGGVSLRVGAYGGSLDELPIFGADMSAPTWRGRSQVWVVVDARTIVCAVDRGDGTWATTPVDSREFSGGQPITGLRLSRDGTRVAGVVGGRIVVAGVSGDTAPITLEQPRVLTGGPRGFRITGLDWVADDSLIAITDNASVPVVEVTANGFRWSPYSSSNLLPPLTAVTAAPGRKVVVADGTGLWQASGEQELWQPMQVPIGAGSIPFYAG